jgi:hypothetical protein
MSSELLLASSTTILTYYLSTNPSVHAQACLRHPQTGFHVQQ